MNRWPGVLAVMGLVAAFLVAPPAAEVQAAASGHCPAWHEKGIASGLGILESLLPDNHGGMLLSSSSHNAIERLRRNGQVTKLVDAASPGELVWHGKRVMFPTGDDFEDGAASNPSGTLQLLDLHTRHLKTHATGLTMPNGLALGGNGAAYVTRDTGSGTGITRIGARAPHKITTNWSTVADTNGISINRRTHTMYVDQTFTPGGPIIAIPMRHPARARKVADVGDLGRTPVKGLDDLTMAHSGVLYLPANGGGELFSYDPRTHTKCLIGSGLLTPSDVTIGTGHGWRKGALFVCGFDGTVREFYK